VACDRNVLKTGSHEAYDLQSFGWGFCGSFAFPDLVIAAQGPILSSRIHAKEVHFLNVRQPAPDHFATRSPNGRQLNP
jgi:hypothetical protein